jgi:hypothetical protein
LVREFHTGRRGPGAAAHLAYLPRLQAERPRLRSHRAALRASTVPWGATQISYAGPDAVGRGRLALEIVSRRLELTGAVFREVRYELIGVDAILGPRGSPAVTQPAEVRARVAARTDSLREALRIGNEVEALYTNGPADGGGATRSAREVIAIYSALVPRHLAAPTVHHEGT